MSAPEQKLGQLRLAFTRHRITDRADVLRLAADHVGRYLWSTKAMTETEVDALTARLNRLPVGGLPSHAARLRRAEEAAASAAAHRVLTPEQVAAHLGATILTQEHP